MAYRNAVYTAFYVREPFSSSQLGASATPDFNYYHLLQAWKAEDASFPFVDAHAKTYNVRDGSDWEGTLKPRLHERLGYSKKLLLILSDDTKASRALSEEMGYGIGTLGLPVVIAYPHLAAADFVGHISSRARARWEKLPAFSRRIGTVPMLHIPFEKELIRRALDDDDFSIGDAVKPGNYYYNA